MSCCRKRKTVSPRVQNVLEKQEMFSNVFKAFKSLDADPSKLDTKKLNDYHYKTHMLYSIAIKRKPPNIQFINSIIDVHDRLVKEMIKREIKHNTPLQKV